MKGFMCHSTAVCMADNGTRNSTIILPRRPNRRTLIDDDYSRLINSTSSNKYSRLLIESAAAASNKKISGTVLVPSCSSIRREQHPSHQDCLSKSKHINKKTAASSDQAFQVVVMRVALHCQGCARKVKKLLSKMEGVTSFSIDLETKRVTVMGHVSPAGVLESISKVKRAELWTC